MLQLFAAKSVRGAFPEIELVFFPVYLPVYMAQSVGASAEGRIISVSQHKTRV